MDTNTATTIAIIVGVLFAVTVTIISVVFVVRKKNQKNSRRRQSLEIKQVKIADSKRLFLIKSLFASFTCTNV